MTNLYDFLRRIRTEAINASPNCVPLTEQPTKYVAITEQDLDWLKQFLRAPDFKLEFKATKTGETPQGEPVYAQDFAIAGEAVDIFCLLTEAMLQNHQFADQVVAAASFYREHVPKCPDCSKRHFSNQKPVMSWDFSPHKSTDK